jgi:cytochrome c553
MTPHPPYLTDTVRKWNRSELFHIVKHGIKFTGMPAWPAQQRDDEVWAVVAFLVRLPHITDQEYIRLTRGELAEQAASAPVESLSGREETPDGVFESCGRCHGVQGRSRRPDSIPILAGQSSTYMENALLAFATGQRHSGIMEPIAAALNADSIRELASYYSKLSGLASQADNIAPALSRGEEIAQKGIPGQRVPACADCHGPGSAPRSPAYPVLAGQHAEYLVLQLALLKEQRRGGSPYAHIMQEIAPKLTMEQIRDVASYYERLGSAASHRPAGTSPQ